MQKVKEVTGIFQLEAGEHDIEWRSNPGRQIGVKATFWEEIAGHVIMNLTWINSSSNNNMDYHSINIVACTAHPIKTQFINFGNTDTNLYNFRSISVNNLTRCRCYENTNRVHFPTKYAVSGNNLVRKMVSCLPLVQQVRGSNPGGVVNFHLKIFNLGARRGGDVHFLIARLYITGLD